MSKLLHTVQIGGDNFLIPLSRTKTGEEFDSDTEEPDTQQEVEKNTSQQEIVIGDHNDDMSLGIQRSDYETFRIGGFIDTSGNISGTFEYLRDSANEKDINETDPENTDEYAKKDSHYYGTSLNLSTDSNENSLVATAGTVKYFGDDDQYKFTGKAGVGAFGSNADIRLAVGVEIERELKDRMTNLFARATAQYAGNDAQYELSAGVRRGIFEAGVKHNEHTGQPDAYIGLSRGF